MRDLRARLRALGVDGFLIPRADRHQGEYVPACDERLRYVSGFGGSAGMALVLADRAAIFVDGRYELAVREEVDLSIWEPVFLRETSLAQWLVEHAPGKKIGFDPWLHTPNQIAELSKRVEKAKIALVALPANPLDALWHDRPGAPQAPASVHPEALAGQSSSAKRSQVAARLREEGLAAAFLSLPDSLCWLLNIRGSDVPCTPLVLSFGLICADGTMTLFSAPAKFDAALRAHLGEGVAIEDWSALESRLRALAGETLAGERQAGERQAGEAVGLDPDSAPEAVRLILEDAGARVAPLADPCVLPKACKNAVEIAGARAAHRRDGAAMVRFLAWLDREAPGGALTELSVAQRLRAIREETASMLGSELVDVSFETISGFGPNGAVVHYRVDERSSLPVKGDGVLLVDSGGQYRDGTTDITRTMAIGMPEPQAQRAFTLVLKGMIAISRLKFPPKTAGRELDAFARHALWQAGLDYDHGTGHGIGSFLSVHEGPQGISKRSGVALAPGMILSNEPGYYRAGAFGIRIENLVLVREPALPAGGEREMLSFETLTLVPIDRRMLELGQLSADERDWLDLYHAQVLAQIGPLLRDPAEKAWLEQACAPLEG
ncbi:MAG: aminopeptidase P family protein [Neomegalonema sp.]|nr:aminopeptidase P family protein [Neomegalonema sp.]